MDSNSPFTDEEMAMLRPVFITSGREHLDSMAELQPEIASAMPDGDALKRFHRAIHSLKGAAMQMGFLQIGGLARLLERVVLTLQEQAPDDDESWQGLLDRGRAALGQAITATEQNEAFTPDGELVTELEDWLAAWEQDGTGDQRATG